MKANVKDRILFNHHNSLYEGVIVEVSPSEKHIKVSYVYRGTPLEKWKKKRVLIEVLGKRNE